MEEYKKIFFDDPLVQVEDWLEESRFHITLSSSLLEEDVDTQACKLIYENGKFSILFLV